MAREEIPRLDYHALGLICGIEIHQQLDTAHKPVSYTHLRAHETPEHLVCRLLLEKKKKKKKKNKQRNTTEKQEYTRYIVR